MIKNPMGSSAILRGGRDALATVTLSAARTMRVVLRASETDITRAYNPTSLCAWVGPRSARVTRDFRGVMALYDALDRLGATVALSMGAGNGAHGPVVTDSHGDTFAVARIVVQGDTVVIYTLGGVIALADMPA
jgi:hypothetical protein